MPELFQDNDEFANDLLIVLDASLNAEVAKQSITLEQLIRKMRSQGIDDKQIRTFLLRDLQEGGQIFGDFKKQIKANVKGFAEDVQQNEIKSAFEDVELWDWLGIADNKICPDCLDRHGSSAKTYEEWSKIGLPRAGTTICQENCRCDLIPAGSINKSDWNPIRKK